MKELPFSRIKAPAQYQERFRTKYVEPENPGKGGRVMLLAIIGKDGKVLEVTAREGDPLLAEAAMQAVQQWVYDPLKVNGIAVEVAAEIEMDFA
jgi:TonB family protein